MPLATNCLTMFYFNVAKWCSLMYGELGKVHVNIITKERIFLPSPKNGRYIATDNVQAKRFCKEKQVKNIGEYHDFHVQSNILLLANVFDTFRKICLEIYELDPA